MVLVPLLWMLQQWSVGHSSPETAPFWIWQFSAFEKSFLSSSQTCFPSTSPACLVVFSAIGNDIDRWLLLISSCHKQIQTGLFCVIEWKNMYNLMASMQNRRLLGLEGVKDYVMSCAFPFCYQWHWDLEKSSNFSGVTHLASSRSRTKAWWTDCPRKGHVSVLGEVVKRETRYWHISCGVC